MSDLVGNPEDRFSQNEAHIIGSQCGGTISKSVGTLTLNDSDGRFGIPVPNGIDCLWNLTAPRDMLMEIYILQFQVDLGNHDHCSIASVEVNSLNEVQNE